MTALGSTRFDCSTNSEYSNIVHSTLLVQPVRGEISSLELHLCRHRLALHTANTFHQPLQSVRLCDAAEFDVLTYTPASQSIELEVELREGCGDR